MYRVTLNKSCRYAVQLGNPPPQALNSTTVTFIAINKRVLKPFHAQSSTHNLLRMTFFKKGTLTTIVYAVQAPPPQPNHTASLSQSH